MQFDMHEMDPWGRPYYAGGVPVQPSRMPQGQNQMPASRPNVVPTPPGAGEDFVAPFDYAAPEFHGSAAPHYNLPSLPTFTGPKFVAPTADSIYADPSYKFRLSQGIGALENSAAARGSLRTGGHLKDLSNYAEDAASQEYGNIFNRAAQAYGLDYTRAKDQYAPLLMQYNNKFNLAEDQGNRAFDREWQQYVFPQDDEFRREQLLANLGLPG